VIRAAEHTRIARTTIVAISATGLLITTFAGASDVPVLGAAVRDPTVTDGCPVRSATIAAGASVVADSPVQVNVDDTGVNIVGDAANEPTLAVDPTAPNRMVVAWRQFDDVTHSHRTAGWATSNDGGRSWRFHGSIDGDTFRTDPVLDADDSGRFYYMGLAEGNESCDLFLSDDGGSSWSDAIPAFGGDKEWMAVDGERRHVYASWSDSIGCCGPRIFTRSLDGGASFSEPVAIEPAPSLGTVSVGPDGEVYVAGITENLDDFVVARSSNASDPDTEPTFDIAHVDLGGLFWILIPPNPYGLAGQVWIAADTSAGPRRGNLYLACSVVPRGSDDPMDLHFARSVDGGESWSDPVAVASDDRGAWQWFGTMSVAPTGRIDLVWVETLDAAEPSIGDIRSSSSDDGGDTWSAPTAISEPFDSLIGQPPDEKIGDYFHMRSDALGADLAFAATFNGEQDIYFVRIGPRDCNGNHVPDADDLAAATSPDCNRNDIPDECDLAAGLSADSDGNGVPDECRPPAPRRATGRVGG